jgi:cupin fold WbuC family metalloprotein
MGIVNFSAAFLDGLTEEAERSARSRQHRNLHAHYNEPCQRLFNAIGMDSYIRPHRHSDATKTECLIAVRGLMTLIVFDETGAIIQSVKFGHSPLGFGDAGAVSCGVEVLPGTWHTVIADRPGSILFEVKPGPFNQKEAKEWPTWAPPEGVSDAVAYLAKLRKLCSQRVSS